MPTIPNIDEYTGNTPVPGQSQPEFNQNTADELAFMNQLPTQMNPSIDAINQTATEIENNAANAAASETNAALSESQAAFYAQQSADNAALANGNYAGEFISGTTSATAGENYLFDGVIWLCLSNTTTDPARDNAAWKNRFDELDAVAVANNVPISEVAFLVLGVSLSANILRDTANERTLIAWDTLTTPYVITSITANIYAGYDVVTDQGTFEFVTPDIYALRGKNGYPTSRKESYAKGWGAVDNTECTIQTQRAIDESVGMDLWIDGDYQIDPIRSDVGNSGTVHVHGLITRDNTVIRFQPNTKLSSIPTSVDRYCVLLLESSNVKIYDPVIVGDVDTHIGTTGEWGYGIRFDYNSSKCRVYNPRVTKCWGDSYVIVSDFGDIVLDNPYGAYSRRQGLSVIRGKQIVINNYHFEFISGTAPQSGIDFEPDNENEVLEVTLNGGRTNDCAGYDIDFFFARQTVNSKPHNIVFNGVHSIGQWIRFNSVANTNVKNFIHFDDLILGEDDGFDGVLVHEAANSCDLIEMNNLVTDSPMFFRLTPRDETSVIGLGNVKIKNLTLKDESLFTRVATLTNPSELSKFTFNKKDAISIENVNYSDSFDLGSLINSSNASLPISIEKIKSTNEIGGTTFSLSLSNFQGKDIILTRSANTAFSVSQDSFLRGITKTIKGVDPLYTTRLDPSAGITINGQAGNIEYQHPFLIELTTENGVDYVSKLIYGSLV